MRIGLFFGSFNPIHHGHLALTNYIVEFSEPEQIWFVISPHNPFKKKNSLLKDYDRYELVYRAIADSDKFRISGIEFNMPQPSYTIDTLVRLSEKFPQHSFSLIMGADNLQTLHRWKNYEQILSDYRILVYPRPGYHGGDLALHHSVTAVDAPQMDISSSFIRKAIKAGKDVRYFMPLTVWNYIVEMNFYK